MGKKKISITLEREYVDFIDGKVDGTDIRNRSHCIEKIIKIQMMRGW